MKGIVLAGGSGTRLYPITLGISKQLMPIYDKPMIYYPINTLIDLGIKDILIITTPHDLNGLKKVLGDGSQVGCNFSYEIQKEPKGIAEAFIIGEKFIGEDSVCLILGDNIFHNLEVQKIKNLNFSEGGLIFAIKVNNPKRYGVVEFDNNFNAISIEEKPENPKSEYAIPGLYFYDNKVIEYAKNLKPSKRLEYEITDISNIYLKNNDLKVFKLEDHVVWLDTGTIDSMMTAINFVINEERRTGRKIGCIEETSYKKGLINEEQLRENARKLLKSGYGDYLLNLLE